jgi:hypothetical protein
MTICNVCAINLSGELRAEGRRRVVRGVNENLAAFGVAPY